MECKIVNNMFYVESEIDHNDREIIVRFIDLRQIKSFEKNYNRKVIYASIREHIKFDHDIFWEYDSIFDRVFDYEKS